MLLSESPLLGQRSNHEPLPKKQKLKRWSSTPYTTISALEKNAAVIPQQMEKNLYSPWETDAVPWYPNGLCWGRQEGLSRELGCCNQDCCILQCPKWPLVVRVTEDVTVTGLKQKGLTHQFVSLAATELRLNARKVA